MGGRHIDAKADTFSHLDHFLSSLPPPSLPSPHVNSVSVQTAGGERGIRTAGRSSR